MRDLFAALGAAARHDAPVLLVGEAGVGKRTAAYAVHAEGARSSGPFVVLDARQVGGAGGALAPGAAALELRFDDALALERAGRQATRGTLLLRGAEELSDEQQRVLEECLAVAPRGGGSPGGLGDVRLIASTRVDLGAAVDAGTFRPALFRALSATRLRVPPLRERIEDLASLLAQHAALRGRAAPVLSAEDAAALSAYPWPGNVRELHAVLDRWEVLGGELSRVLPRTDAANVVDPHVELSFHEAKTRWVAEFERRYLAVSFARSGGNVTRAAAQAGLSRRHFRMLLEQHGLRGEAGAREAGEGERPATGEQSTRPLELERPL